MLDASLYAGNRLFLVYQVVIYNILGQEVKVLIKEYRDAGSYQIKWDGTNNAGSKVASGMYIYRIQAGKFTSAKKMVLMK